MMTVSIFLKVNSQKKYETLGTSRMRFLGIVEGSQFILCSALDNVTMFGVADFLIQAPPVMITRRAAG